MSRAGENDVRAIIQADSTIDNLFPFITVAEGLVDYVDSRDTENLLTAHQLKQIEIYLAAHFYASRDQQYSSNKTGDASAKFQVGISGIGPMELNDWGRHAMMLDITGTLSRLNEQNKKGKTTPQAVWLGREPSTQTDYVDRD